MSSATLVGGEDEVEAPRYRDGIRARDLHWSKSPTTTFDTTRRTTYDIDIPTPDDKLYF